MSDSADHDYVSRGGLKLAAALKAFGLSPAGWVCADLGSNVGGFVDCLLRAGATRVYAVDTGYGVLAYRLRRDPRVVVRERTNALHVTLPEPADLVTIDVAWTSQEHILPAAVRMLWREEAERREASEERREETEDRRQGTGGGRPETGEGREETGGGSGEWPRRGHIVTLIKPHYEARAASLRGGVLPPHDARVAFEAVCDRIRGLGLAVVQTLESPIRGRKGNVEYLALLSPSDHLPALRNP